jgi:deazaflavin-dependent oxidoreductase (nitroreductase family)
MSYRHVILYSMSRGRIDPSDDRAGFIKLTTVGRKSGKQRTVHLMYMKDGSAYVVTASNAGKENNPGWFYNLQSNPDVMIEVKNRQSKAVAEVAAPEKRGELWARWLQIAPMYGGYEKRSPREIPMVLLRPVDER